MQAPIALQISLPLQALASAHEVPAATGVWLTPVDGLHASAVHGLLSSITGAAPAIQAPDPLQASLPLHKLASAHEVPAATGVWLTPVDGPHASAVHGLPSSMATAEPGVQVPAWQASPAVHALLSLHAVPLGATGFEHAPVLGSQVPGT